MYKRKDSGNYWIIVNGVRQSSGTSDKKRAAYLEAKLNNEAFDRERLGVTKTQDWDDACLSWFKANQHLKSIGNQGYIAKLLKPALTGINLSDITRERVGKIMSGLVTAEPSAKNATINNRVDFISKIVRHGGLVPPKFSRYPTAGGRERFLNADEWWSLSGAMPDDFRQLCTFALVTGLREANVMGFRWEWVRGDVLMIPAEFTKTGKTYALPINSVASAILEERRKAPITSLQNVFLCDGRPWYRVLVHRAMTNALRASKVAPITFHGLRHTFASWMTQEGVPWEIVSRLGCWKTSGMVNRYAHLSVDHLRPHSEIICTILSRSKLSNCIYATN